MSKSRNIADLGSNDVIETSATGVDVTGTITADGLTVDGAASITNASDTPLTIAYNASNSSSYGYYQIVNNNTGNPFEIHTGGTKTLNLGSNGDVSFYEDTGTTAKMVWDASAESLGIGTSSPTTNYTNTIHVHSATNGASVHLTDAGSGSTANDGLEVFQYGVDGYVWERGNGTLRFGTNATERMRIDSAGNVGIGTASPNSSAKLQIRVANDQNIAFQDTGGNPRISAYNDAVNASLDLNFNGANLKFETGGSERARIDSSGNLLVGRTSQLGANSKLTLECNATTDDGLTLNDSYTGAGSAVSINFYRNSTKVGSITNTTSSVAYNTTSDERLKENIKDATHVVNIDDIKVREYDWKVDGEHQRFGFIAQELETVYPEAVHSPEDPEEMKSVDYSKLVPLLVKEIQTLKARIETLENN